MIPSMPPTLPRKTCCLSLPNPSRRSMSLPPTVTLWAPRRTRTCPAAPVQPAHGQLFYHVGIVRRALWPRSGNDRHLSTRCGRTRRYRPPHPGHGAELPGVLHGDVRTCRQGRLAGATTGTGHGRCVRVPCRCGLPGKGRRTLVRPSLPTLRDLFNYHIIFTTPYVLTETSKADWTAYLNKSILETGRTDRRTALYEVLKYGREPRFWSEFIFLGYHHHQPDAIFLAGLPDVKGSLPHAH